MTAINHIGLETEQSLSAAKSLNILLANFQIYYQNLRGLHWNIKGKNFFELHLKFEELYTDSQIKIDLIAERILTLGAHPMHTFEEYLSHATLRIGKNIHKDHLAVELIVENLTALIELERPIASMATEGADDGTTDMLSTFIAEQEKTLWMFRSWMA
jgi:starvation-inducible DNA-binding protein